MSEPVNSNYNSKEILFIKFLNPITAIVGLLMVYSKISKIRTFLLVFIIAAIQRLTFNESTT